MLGQQLPKQVPQHLKGIRRVCVTQLIDHAAHQSWLHMLPPALGTVQPLAGQPLTLGELANHATITGRGCAEVIALQHMHAVATRVHGRARQHARSATWRSVRCDMGQWLQPNWERGGGRG